MHPRHDTATTRQLADAQERAAGNIVHHSTMRTDTLPTRHVVETVAPMLPNSTVVVTRDGDTVIEFTRSAPVVKATAA